MCSSHIQSSGLGGGSGVVKQNEAPECTKIEFHPISNPPCHLKCESEWRTEWIEDSTSLQNPS